MVQKIGISVADWLYKEIENRRGDKNRSEYIEELIAQALGFSVVENDILPPAKAGGFPR